MTEYQKKNIDRWLRDTEKYRPWHEDPRILALRERDGLVEDTIEYIQKMGHPVCELKVESITSTEGRDRIRIRMRESFNQASNGILLIRELNNLPEMDQYSIWADWLNRASPTPGPPQRFAFSFIPFDGETPAPQYDVQSKLNDLSTIV